MKRKIAILLVLALLLSVVPVEGLAISGEESSQTDVTQPIPETQPADAENELEVPLSTESKWDAGGTYYAVEEPGLEVVKTGTCGENIRYTLYSNQLLKLSGTGAVTWDLWYELDNQALVESVVIEKGITAIDSGAFSGCSSLKSIAIAQSVTSIGSYAFEDCSSLTAVTIPKGVLSIGGYTFWNCTNLKTVTLPKDLTSIGECAFSGCTSLTEVTIPDGINHIGDYAFNWCQSLESITLPASLTCLGEGAFNECRNLTGQIIIPEGINEVGYSTFFFFCEKTDGNSPAQYAYLHWRLRFSVYRHYGDENSGSGRVHWKRCILRLQTVAKARIRERFAASW